MISSRDNPRLLMARALRERRGRREQRAYLVEGVTLVLEALAASRQPLAVFRDDTRLGPGQRAALDVALAPLVERVHPVAPAAFRTLADTETPQGVIAVLPLPAAGPPPRPRPGDLLLIADAIQDPGNLGTMLRTAEAAGARAVITTPGTVDPFGPKVVRAGMGAHFRLLLAADVPWPALTAALGDAVPLLGADSSGARRYDAVDWTRGGALVVGNEAGGLSDAARAATDELIAIPLAPPVDSLNAAIATAVILFEAARQRRGSAR